MEDTDFHELGSQLLTEFGGIHQRVSRFVDKALSGEMAVMRALMLAGGSLTPSELADRAWVSNARIANILRALEAKGWVERQGIPGSRNQTPGIRGPHRGFPRTARRNRYPRDGAPS